MSYDDETPAPTRHLTGRCSHAVGLMRCSLPHGHAGLHLLASEALATGSIDARVSALEAAVAECVAKVRALERADAKGCIPALELACCGACALRKGGRCGPRNIGVDAADVACVLFRAEGQAP